ncbi:MAG: hypothetical protein JSR82_14820 [Verrucomicrobia bacterium]|nr:hypothetical protein [Verrucomicrobiota bacterium]
MLKCLLRGWLILLFFGVGDVGAAPGLEAGAARRVAQARARARLQHWQEARTHFEAALAALADWTTPLAREAVQGSIGCAERLERWDDAFELATRFVERTRGRFEEAVGLRLLAGLHQRASHDQDRRKFGLPGREEGRSLASQEGWAYDFRAAVGRYEEARLALERLAASPAAQTDAAFARLVRAERIGVNFDLAALLTRSHLDATTYPAAGPHHWWWEPRATNLVVRSDGSTDLRILGERSGNVPLAADGRPEIVPTPERYEPTDGDGRRVLFLLAEVERLDTSERREDAATARLRRAYLARALYDVGPALRELEPERNDGIRFSTRRSVKPSGESLPPVHSLTEAQSLVLVQDRPRVVELPAEENPLILFREVGRRFPGARAAVEAEVAEALYFRSRRQFPDAVRCLRAFLRRHPRDPQCAFVQEALREIARPEVALSQPPPSQLPERALLEFEVRNATQIEFVAYRLDHAGWLLARGRADAEQDLAAGPKWKNHRLGFPTRWAEKVPTRGHLPLRGRTQPKLAAGAYVIEARVLGGHGVATISYRVSEEALLLKATPGHLLAFLADARTGAPLVGRELKSVVWSEDQPPRPQVTSHRTGAEGEALIPVGKRAGEDVQVFHRNAQGAVVTARLDGANRERLAPKAAPAWRGSFVTDRPIYRPGQTVRFRLWLRAAEGRALAAARSGQAVEVRLAPGYRGDEEGALKLSAVTDDAGGVSGEFQLPRDAQLGFWSLAVRGEAWSDVRGSIQVEEYRRPEFEVVVSFPTPEPKFDQKFKVRVEARYLHGGPVANGRANISVSRQPYDLLEPGWSRALRYPWLAWSQPSESDSSPVGHPPETRWREKLVLGPDGSAELEIDPQRYGVEARFRYDYYVEASVTDASRRSESGTNQCSMAQREYAARLQPERIWFDAPGAVRVNVLALPTSGRPRAFTGTVSLLRLTYPAGEAGDASEEPLSDVAAHIAESGEGAVTVPVPSPGQYRVRYVGRDRSNNLIEANALFWVGGPGFEGRRLRFQDLELIADRPTYRAGETMRVLVASRREGARLLVVDDARDGLLRSWRFVQLRDRVEVLSFPIAQDFSGERFFEALLVHDGQLFRARETVEVTRPETELKITLEPDRASYLPGESGTMRVTVRDVAGLPVTGELALAAWDDALRKFAQRNHDVWSDLHRSDERHFELTASSVGSGRDRYRGSSARVADASLFRFSGLADWDGYWLPEVLGLSLVDPGATSRFGLAGYEKRVLRGVSETPWGEHRNSGEPARVIVTGSYIPTSEGGDPPPANTPTEGMRQLPSYVGNTAKENDSKGEPDATGTAPKPAPTFQAAQTRTNFAETALWLPRLALGADGTASAPFSLPDSLTRWEFLAVAVGSGNQAGEGSTKVVSAKRVLVRLHTPRFLIERDELTLSVTAHNYLDRPQLVRSELTLPRRSFELTTGAPPAPDAGSDTFTLRAEATIAAGGEQRFDWPVRALETGPAKLAAKALTAEESDALELELPVHPHVATKQLAQVGSFRLRAEGTRTLTFEVPAEIESAHTELVVTLQPTLAHVLVETLPFLIEYPYGCVEQTMSRFYPAAVVAGTLRRQGLRLEQFASSPTLERRARQFGAKGIYDSAELDRLIRAGLARLGEMQKPGSGWGWWTGDGVSALQTAYVVQGLRAVREAGYAVPEGLFTGGMEVLRQRLEEMTRSRRGRSARLDTEDAFVAYVFGLGQKPGAKSAEFAAALRRLYADRARLTHQGRALLALALQRAGQRAEAAIVLRNLLQYLQRDDANETAWIRPAADGWWHWYRQDVETNAWALRAVLAIEPRSTVAPRLVKWLVEHRAGGTHWRSTRDTALALEALAEFLRVSGEGASDSTVRVQLDANPAREIRLAPGGASAEAGRMVWSGAELSSGRRTLSLNKQGSGALYYSARLRFRTREPEIAPAGGDLAVERRYFRVSGVAGGEAQRVPLQAGETVRSGEEIEVVLLLKAKNDYDFLAFEDPKPAGCEAVALTSGSTYADGFCANLELRDEKVVFFVADLPRGERVLTYRLRAETPGVFRAPPATGFAMYAPELRANSATARLRVGE